MNVRGRGDAGQAVPLVGGIMAVAVVLLIAVGELGRTAADGARARTAADAARWRAPPKGVARPPTWPRRTAARWSPTPLTRARSWSR